MDLENLKKRQSESEPLLISVRGQRFGVKKVSSKCRVACCVFLLLLTVAIATGLGVGLGLGLRSKDTATETLVDAIKTDNLMLHLQELQSIASKYNPQSRAVQYGYNDSAEYVIGVLEKHGYQPTRQEFTVPIYEQLSLSLFAVTIPDTGYVWTFLEGAEYAVMRYAGSGQISNANIIIVDNGGCSPDDFSGVATGDVVLLNYTIPPKACSLYDRTVNAKEAGAAGVVMMRQENDENAIFPPTTRVYTQNSSGIFTVDLPVLGASYQLGQKLLDLFSLSNQNLTVSIETATSVTDHTTYNVLASTPTGRNDSIIVSGTHLDSVPAGPGINDNGSGSSANLVMAVELAKLKISPENKVLFAWWGAEELGLFGSTHFVFSLGTDDIMNYACNLNFDMIGSPNFARMIYNGSQADESIREASITIQSLFEERFRSQSLDFQLTDFTGRSDYGPFIENGIPAGGLFTGAEEEKTAEQQMLYGGLTNAPLDPCYHEACDTYDNVNEVIFRQMAQAAAYTLSVLMQQRDLQQFLNSTSFSM